MHWPKHALSTAGRGAALNWGGRPSGGMHRPRHAPLTACRSALVHVADFEGAWQRGEEDEEQRQALGPLAVEHLVLWQVMQRSGLLPASLPTTLLSVPVGRASFVECRGHMNAGFGQNSRHVTTATAGTWTRAVVQRPHLVPNVITNYAAVSLCEKGKQWRQVLGPWAVWNHARCHHLQRLQV
jgi:hypothetical protein